MSRRPSVLVFLGIAMFFLGLVLVFVSGYSGDSTGNFGSSSEWVWRVGGLMVYASIPALVIAGVLSFTNIRRSGARRSRSG
jgi:uncharacterized membrane protein